MRSRFCFLLIAVIALWPRSASATGDPTLEWWTYETEHFRVHYPRPVEPVARRVAMLAETIHGRVAAALGYHATSRTEIVLSDDTDSANGSATPIPYNTIRLFVTAPEDMSPLGDYDDWYLDLVTHEYTHIAHIDNISGAPAVLNAIIGKTFAPNQIQPRWIIEGLAVVHETQHSSAGRLRASLFDMYLRADVLANHIAGLDQISSTAYRWPQGNLWYLYGSRFLGWISDVYGAETFRAVSADYGASVIPFGINRAIRRVTGRTYVELYEGFKDNLRRRYAEQMREVEHRGLREGTRLTSHGRTVIYPRFVPAGMESRAGAKELLYYRDDLDARSGLYRIDLAAPSKGPPAEELVARSNGPSGVAFQPDGALVFNSVSVFRNEYSRNDLFSIPRGTTSKTGDDAWRRRLTTGLRAQGPDVSRDGRQVVFTVDTTGTTYLEIADVARDGTLVNRRDLVPSGRFEQAYTPRFSPDGALVAYSAWTAGGYRDIRIVDVATGRFYLVSHDRALDMHPEWSPDGRTLYFTSDRTGIANVYAYDLARHTLAQVTNVRMGAYCPAVSPDGKTLVYVGYTTDGFDLYAMPLDPASYLEALPAPEDRPDPPTEPSEVRLEKERYNFLQTVAPRSFTFDYQPGNFGGYAFIVSAAGADVVGHHGIGLTLVADKNAPEPQFAIDYAYRRLPFDLGVHFFHSATPRADFRINDQVTTYTETQTGITSGISYPLRLDYATHTFGLSYSMVRIRDEVPIGTQLDPYATATILPRADGLMGIVHAGYSFSNAESALATVGPVRGVSLDLGVDYAGPETAAQFTLRAFEASLTGYIEMPWRGYHVLALRMAGGISSGTYPRGGLYYVGGYDLQNYSLVDSIRTGALNGAFVVRGYGGHAFSGNEYLLDTAEYRFPIAIVDHGLSTLPFYFRRMDANVFVDYGGAFNDLGLRDIGFFRKSGDAFAFIDAPQMHTSIGAELWLSFVLGYGLSAQLRLGYAYGFSRDVALSSPCPTWICSSGSLPGQIYFVASGAF